MGYKKKYDIQEIPLTVALGASSGTADDICNPLRGTLKKVEVKCADDGNVNGMKVELLRDLNWRNYHGAHEIANRTPSYGAVYTGSQEQIADDDSWNSADPDKDISVPLSFARDGYYTWRITPDLAPAAAMSVSIRRVIEI